jgi:dihydropteroate synthase
MTSPPVLLHCADKTIDLRQPVVMGVLNITPDSFSDGGRFASVADAVAGGLRMAADGAALIDVGGESTRPGAQPVSAADELRRVLPVIEGLRAATTAVISVDTSKPEVMRAAAAAGAGFINDVRALRVPGALQAAAASGCGICLMHMQGEPPTMQQAPHYTDVVGEVRAFLVARVAACRNAGIDAARLTVDPGFGFGKNLEHNLILLRHLADLAADGTPLLVGLSRKATVGTLTGRPPAERVYGSVALAVLAALKGARIVRTHDVAATVDALKVTAAVQGPDGD